MGWIWIRMDPELLPWSRYGTRKIQSCIRNKSFRIRNTVFYDLTATKSVFLHLSSHWSSVVLYIECWMLWCRLHPAVGPVPVHQLRGGGADSHHQPAPACPQVSQSKWTHRFIPLIRSFRLESLVLLSTSLILLCDKYKPIVLKYFI